jgi:putative membrane protein
LLKFIIRWLTTAVGIGMASYLLPGIGVDDIRAAVLGALALGLVNVTHRPIILLLTLPLTC